MVNDCMARCLLSGRGLEVVRDGKKEDVNIQNEQNRRHWAAPLDTSGFQVRCTTVSVDGRVVTEGGVEAANEAYEEGWDAIVLQGAEKGPVGYAVISLVEVHVKAVRRGAVLVLSKDLENVI